MDSASGLTDSLKSQNDQSKLTSTPPSDSRSIYQGMISPKGFPGLPEGWVSEWETFPSSDGTLQLFAILHHAQKWEGHRALVIFHGGGEHGGRYLHFPHYVKSVVDSVYCLDHRGHGRSEGLRGHVDRFDLFAEDGILAIRRLEAHLKRRFGKAEIHLFGHSLGGLIALRTLLASQQLPLASVTVSAPLLGLKMKVPPVKKMVGLALSRVWGSLHMTNELDPKLVCRDPEVVSAYVKDRLVHKKITPLFYTSMVSAMENTLKRTTDIHDPILFQVPLHDQIVNGDVTQKYYRSLKVRDKELKTYPDFFHESYNELGKETAFGDLTAWIQSHSKKL